MTPTWTYHPSNLERVYIDLDTNAKDVPLWCLKAYVPPDEYRSEDLRLAIVVQFDGYHEVAVYRTDRKGKRVFIGHADDSLDHREVIRRLNEVRPWPSKPKEWDEELRQAIAAK